MTTTDSIQHTVNHLFRQESGKMVAVLVKIFGTEHVELAEDVLQDALVAALESWKYKGVPDNPKAWLYRTAKNKAIDIIRHNKFSQTFDFSDPAHQLLNSGYTLSGAMDTFWEEHSIKDEFLGMMYACCHPGISPENQVTFILKSLCGFTTREVARSFLTQEDTVSKRIYRTKEFFRKNKVKPEIPDSTILPERTGTVLSAIYLLFNEGYNSTHSDELVRKDLIAQAMSLCRALLEVDRTRLPEVYALMALMCFHSARLDSRITTDGELVILSEQERSKWDMKLVGLGNKYLNKSAFGSRLSTYHIEAAIAYQHCTAINYEDTNWKMILDHYNQLWELTRDPVVWLNRARVILELEGPEKAWEYIRQSELVALQKYYLYPAILGEIYLRMDKKLKALHHFRKAMELTQSSIERKFLRRKIASLEEE